VQISTIADTWIHLTNISQAGERNRALTIVKSRGMKHSNQVRELILSDEGIALADVYAAAGDVLMGTARWQKEAAEKTEQERILAEVEHKRSEVAPTIPGWSWPLDFSHGVGLFSFARRTMCQPIRALSPAPPASHLRSLARISDGRKES
jgi:hypothetical protein